MLCFFFQTENVFCSQLFGFFSLVLSEWQPRNRQIHRQVCWKRHRISGGVGKQRNIGFVGFLGNVEPKWCRKCRKWLCCKNFVTKSKLKASLAVWQNLLPNIFQGGLHHGRPPRRAAPGFQNYFQLKGSSSQFPQVAVCWGVQDSREERDWNTRCAPEIMSSLLNFAYTRQVGQCIHSFKIGPVHILYQCGPTSDLRPFYNNATTRGPLPLKWCSLWNNRFRT